ncbi:hypothetical protein DJ030_16550 [bacterium endosymbiont of Escarpia laminata]|nr:MAG: hypothetical protein DJ030_16550 [bacterium endosymbiont of Escarpia laminata]RLJ19396.1 MAG: hypothetical protein DJ031_08680 [bacterium endosymbiont of Escarpia laminata]
MRSGKFYCRYITHNKVAALTAAITTKAAVTQDVQMLPNNCKLFSLMTILQKSLIDSETDFPSLQKINIQNQGAVCSQAAKDFVTAPLA